MKKQENQTPTTTPPTPFNFAIPDDLYSNSDLAARLNRLNQILNQEPPKEWLEPHPTARRQVPDGNGGKANVPIYYIPAQRLEHLLVSIFLSWSLEIKSTIIAAGAITITVRLGRLCPVLHQWQYHDGIASVALGPNEHHATNLQMNAPAAETMAFKDAAEKIGKLFGKDLNRPDQVYYEDLAHKFSDPATNPVAQNIIGKAAAAAEATRKLLNKRGVKNG